MDSRGNQCSHGNLQKGHPDGQCSKIQDHHLPYRDDLHMDVIGGFQSEEHRRGSHTPGASEAEHPMSRLWGGVNSRIHNGPSQTIAWVGDSD